MAYTTRTALLAKIPADVLLEALDDDRDGVEDADLLDTIIADAGSEIDSLLSGRHEVPFTGDIPPKVTFAALMLTLECIYARRGWNDANGKNPWSKQARDLRYELKDIGMGTKPLFPAKDKAKANTSIISEASKIDGGGGFLDT